jgi:biotin carboxyl carrier protein
VQLDLDIGGRVRRVVVERRDGQYEVRVDDRVFAVDARLLRGDALSLLVREGRGVTRSVDATVTPAPGTPSFEVTLAGRTLHAGLVSRFGRRATEAAGPGGGPQQVTAPMPGKVVRVLVAPGDHVEPRQGLVVIEAMKMENELRATRAGRVKAVRATEGQSVDAGVLLVTVE